MKTILETELLLREFALADAPDFFRLASDPEVNRYTGDSCQSLEEARRGIEERLLRDYRLRGYGRWAAIDKATGALAGFAGLKYLEDLDEVDLGYRFFKPFWGKGLATEAAQSIVAYGFSASGLRLRRIIGIADVENKASIRVLEKARFQFERFATYRGHHVAWYVSER